MDSVNDVTDQLVAAPLIPGYPTQLSSNLELPV